MTSRAHENAVANPRLKTLGLAVTLAGLRLSLLLHKPFNPGQPRVPSGDPGAGQWTSGDDSGDTPTTGDPPTDTGIGPSTGDVDLDKPAITDPNIIPVAGGNPNRNGPGTAANGPQIRLDSARSAAEDLVRQVQDADPLWRKPTGAYETIDGEIAYQESVAEAARQRLWELNRSIGDNGGPRDPLPGVPSTPRIPDLAFPDVVGNYRHNWELDDGKGTVAFGTVDGKSIFGVNSKAPGYTDDDRTEANAMRDTLLNEYPEEMATANIGRMPNDALYHAETTALLRAARDGGGTVLPFFKPRTRQPCYPISRF